MSDNVDPLRRAVQCRPSMSPPVHGGAAVVCAKVAYDVPVLAVVVRRDERRCRTMSTRPDARCSVDTSISPPVHGGTAVVCAMVAYDVPVLAVVVWWNARRCRSMSTRRGARCSVDHRPRCPCTVAPPSCAPRLPTMYQYSLWWWRTARRCRTMSTRRGAFGVDHRRASADVGQCRLASRRARRCRTMSCRPSTSPPVHGGAAVVCAKVAYDVPVLAVVVWWDERRCRTMSTRSGARRSVDHRSRRQCAQVPWND
jgi:hypothetical protein